MKKCLFIALFAVIGIDAQYVPAKLTRRQQRDAESWVNKTYDALSQDEKLGQLFIVALYTNKGEDFIANIRKIVERDKIGGLILMQDDAARAIALVNEFQQKSKIPLLIGMDAEWGLFQRIPVAHKYPWAITLGAIQDKSLIEKMAAQIAVDCKKMGINWDFAPVVDVNTNPANPIIGNRSFGSDVENVTASALAYSEGLQKSGILAAIKHFPGHGDTDTDSHLDLPTVSHPKDRLEKVELKPFKNLIDKNIGGVMVAHLYVPSLEPQKGIPASLSKNIITGILKNKFGYKGLIITDALNMGAVANRYKAGELDAMAFKAGNDIMLFSQDVATGRRLIQQAIDKGEIPQSRVEESVKKILLTKYYLGLNDRKPTQTADIAKELNNSTHVDLMSELYANAITAIKDDKKLLPLAKTEKIYYLPLEEASSDVFYNELKQYADVKMIKTSEITSIPPNSKVLIGIHKDNSTAYKPYKISEQSKQIIAQLAAKRQVILDIFGSPYALRDINIEKISTVIVSYENNPDSMIATAKALAGKTKISGILPVTVNQQLNYGAGITINAKN